MLPRMLASNTFFQSGWRPALGWVCVVSCIWNWLCLPQILVISQLLGHTLTIVPADIGQMLPVVVTLLGLGTLRTIEKSKQVAAP